ncbi:MAG: hypothetical protein CMI18_01970 [Opitutaceae bacterium]|nr:hypothetical protein [Opitutaceae bacterium]
MSKRPHLIVFFRDQQRWDTTGTHGNPLNSTPNFDRMADHGTRIDTRTTCQPVCDHLKGKLLEEMAKSGESIPSILEKERPLTGQRKLSENEIYQ